MQYQKKINPFDDRANQQPKFKTKIGSKQMMTHVERITPIVK